MDELAIFIVVCVGLICMFLSCGAGYYYHVRENKAEDKKHTEEMMAEDKTHTAKTVATDKAATPTVVTTHKIASGCEDSTLKLTCANNGTITTGNVLFGRWDRNTCIPSGGLAANTPLKKKLYTLPNKCIGAKSCSLSDFDTLLGNDPDYGVYKQVKASYTCAAKK